MKDILALNQCPNFTNEVNLSLDGVQESKSSNVSNDIYSLTFKGCQKVFPIRLIRPVNRHKIDNQYHFNEVLEDLALNDTIINNMICDKPKRSNICMTLNQNATFACEYCESPAVHIDNVKEIKDIDRKKNLHIEHLKSEIELLKNKPGTSTSYAKKIADLQKMIKNVEENHKKSLKKLKSKHLCWPCSTANGPPRTMDGINAIVEEIEASEVPLSRQDAKGVVGRSLLLNYPGFSLIEQVPAEYMHSVCIGAVRRLTELTFKVGQIRLRVTKRKLSDPQMFNNIIRLVQLPNELSRRIRNLDFAVMKATEFRNLLIFFFPVVLKCIETKFVKERKLWLQLAFVIRACVISNEEFHVISQATIAGLALDFYKHYEKIYGPSNCTYSIHIVCSHILQIRGNEPLTARSAFIFENFYAEMKNLFCPGTLSPLKQILRNCIMKRQLQTHCCSNPIKYSEMPPLNKRNIGKENNHSIYVLNDGKHCLYSITKINNDNTFTCVKQGKYEAKFDELKKVNWSLVGVYKLGPTCDQPVVINKKDIAGKCIIVNDFIITCPKNVLTEK